ncbi:MAG: chromosome segregation protein SMC [Ignavibacteriae bacterium]|nr:chromosome segregation protein SMC [Ignavibacteriota bacterium]
MYLKKIEIFGFKSFAQKIDLNFDAGLTGIVGPNGCGKTNVVDAIRWALGEQKPTTLRSDKMEDVIFNGTKARKPLSMAEVSLTIENTKGILPTEYSEVTITRRVYRSGEGEYFLNKTLCRLKDIRDLFMDTGMGSDAYSVIELKMVETILSDRADERRRLFEEAAGVTKYKFRRKETYRRLENVQRDLTRVNDIVREVQKAVNSLERQAQKAERYNRLAGELQTLEKDLMAREYASMFAKMEPLKQQLDVAVTEKNRIDVELQQEEALLEVLRTEMREIEERVAETQTILSDQLTVIHEAEQRVATGKERSRSLAVNIEQYEQEKVQLRSEREAMEKKQEALLEQLGRVRESAAQAEETYRQKKEALDEFSRALDEKKAGLKAVQEKVISLLHHLSDLRNSESQSKARVENLRGRMEYTAEENQVFAKEIDQNSELVATLSAEDKELRRKFAEAEVRVHQMDALKNSLQIEIEALRNREFELRSSIDRNKSKMDFLKGLVESFEGVSEGARFLMSNSEWDSSIQTTVGEALTADSRYRVAIESALSESTGFVIVEDTPHAYAAMELLKKSEKGKATFICLDRVPQLTTRRPLFSGDGVIGWATDLIRCDARFRNLFIFLLDGTLVVESLERALRIVNEQPGLRCVTLGGEILTGRGVLRGGSVRQDEGGHIGRKLQLEEIAEEIRALEEERAKLNDEMSVKSVEHAKIDIRKLNEEARTVEQQMTSVEVRIAQLEFEKKRATENIQRNQTERERLGQEIQALKNELDEIVPAIESAERQKTDAERQVGVVTNELEGMEETWNEYSRVANEANVTVLSLKSEERSIQQDIEHVTETIKTLSETFDRRTADIASAKEEIEHLAEDMKETDEMLVSARAELDALKEKKFAADKELTEKRGQVHTIELKLKDERLKHEGSLKSAHDLEFKLQELTMKAEGIKQRAKEEFEVELELQEFPDNEQYDFSAARESVRELKDKIRHLGPVNFAAFEEYKSEKERLDFVNAQRGDLEESEKTLLATIDEINTTAQKQFFSTFEKIRENFIATFKGLFDEGDECDLRLEEGVDPLEARIEIIAKPRGKRPTSIDLLSGGEKTLTAIALLFAIYLVKPSPFCILDEVDAPLDDTNIDRFTRIIKRFADNTQFIVVTHNKRTMEATNALYGVTMEEEGVSKLVSVRFNEALAG